MQLIKSRPKTR